MHRLICSWLQRQLTASLKKIDLVQNMLYILLLSYSNRESHLLKSHWLLWVSVDLIISSTIPRPVFAFSTLLGIATGLTKQATFSQAPFANWILARFGQCEAPIGTVSRGQGKARTIHQSWCIHDSDWCLSKITDYLGSLLENSCIWKQYASDC